MLRSQATRLERTLRATDYGVAAALVFLVFRLRGDLGPESPFPLLWVTVVATVAFPTAIAGMGLYASQRQEPLWKLGGRLVAAGGLVAAALQATVFAIGHPELSQGAAVLAFAQLGVFGGERLLIHGVLRVARLRGRNLRRIVVVGTGARARRFVEEVALHRGWGLQVAALVDEGDVAQDPELRRGPVTKIIDFPNLARRLVIDEVVVAVPRSMLPSVQPVVEECARLGVPVSVLSELFNDVLPNVRASRYGRFPVLRFDAVNHRGTSLAVKRVLDLVGASLALVALSPLVAAACIAIRLEGPGPVLYRQTRLGRNGRPFPFLKLRSMVVQAETLQSGLARLNEMEGPVFKIQDDPRVTRVGRFIRRWSIDELPQLWNVLRGDMSLVGPRPPLPHEVDQYESKDRRRLSVRPGLTCLWQISGRNKIQFAGWVELDLHYIDRWSLWLDLWILLCTPLAVLRRDGAS